MEGGELPPDDWNGASSAVRNPRSQIGSSCDSLRRRSGSDDGGRFDVALSPAFARDETG